MSLLTAKKELEKEIEAGAPRPAVSPRKLPLNAIGVRRELFQHREPLEHHSRHHIKELARALQSGEPLTPIAVLWAGSGWVCIDGHHRLAAYLQGKWQKNVPVRVFEGTIDEALCRAALNTFDKLPMSRIEKSNTAWRLVVGAALSKEQIMRSAGASEGTVASMRRVRRALRERDPQLDLSALRWEQARRQLQGKPESWEEPEREEKQRAEAKRLAGLLAKTFGPKAARWPEAFADALAIYDQRFPDFAAQYWGRAEDDAFDPSAEGGNPLSVLELRDDSAEF